LRRDVLLLALCRANRGESARFPEVTVSTLSGKPAEPQGSAGFPFSRKVEKANQGKYNAPLKIMKKNLTATQQRFRPGNPANLERRPAPVAPEIETIVPYPRTRENPLEVLKNRLLRESLAISQEPSLLAPLRRAANEAASIAWLEPMPLLVFPELFAEKVWVAATQAKQQNRVRNRSVRLMEVFA